MITINLGDPNVVENFKALNELRKTGMFTDEQLKRIGSVTHLLERSYND